MARKGRRRKQEGRKEVKAAQAQNCPWRKIPQQHAMWPPLLSLFGSIGISRFGTFPRLPFLLPFSSSFLIWYGTPPSLMVPDKPNLHQASRGREELEGQGVGGRRGGQKMARLEWESESSWTKPEGWNQKYPLCGWFTQL